MQWLVLGVAVLCLERLKGWVVTPEVQGITIARVSYRLALGALLLWPRSRRRAQFWLQSRGGDLTATSSIAAYIGGHTPKYILERALRTCRCVSLDKVTREDMETSTPDESLQRHACHCRLEDIDAFLSHSWHDPPDLKWEALQHWRRQFRVEYRREPKVWIDKYCIDQTDIQASLMCLPVVLAGCQSLLILAGPTYLTRLWCLEEVFIYLQMGRGHESMELHVIADGVPEQISQFDVTKARCHLAADEDTLLATIEAGCSSFETFNVQVRTAMQAASLRHKSGLLPGV